MAGRGADSLTALGQYLAEVKAHAPLSANEERRLAMRAAGGDRDARNALVDRHLPLVVSIARRYAGHQVPLEDLVQEGNLELIHAAKKFDPARGARFATYATWWIRQHISRAVFGLAHAIRVPRTVSMDIQRLAAATMLQQRHHQRPSDAQLAAAIRRSPARVRFLRSVPGDPLSLDHPLNEERAVMGTAVFPDPAAGDDGDVGLAMRDLPPRLKQIVRLRFGLEGRRQRTLREVGAMLHISRERVRQLEHRALKRLRERLVA